MEKKRYRPEEIVAKLRQVEVLQSQGMSTADAIRQIGVSEVTYYLYGRLSRCKSISSRSAWPVANIYPASPGEAGAPKWGIRAHAPLQLAGLEGLDKSQARRVPVLATHAAIYNHFNIQRHLISRQTLRTFRAEAFAGWHEVVSA